MPRDPWFQRLWWEIFPPPMIKIKVTCHYFDIGDEHTKLKINLIEVTVRGPFPATLRRIVRQGGIITPHQFVPLAKVFLVEEIDGP